MDLQLSDKVVVITGGASGIGLVTARTYSRREGARLVLGDVNEAALRRWSRRCDRGGTAIGVRVDVREYAQCEGLMARAVEEFGRVDVLVNSAGVGGIPRLFMESRADDGDWDAMIDINLRGTMHCCRAVAERMIAQRAGRIVNLASEAGKGNEKRIVVYGATKGGVISLTQGAGDRARALRDHRERRVSGRHADADDLVHHRRDGAGVGALLSARPARTAGGHRADDRVSWRRRRRRGSRGRRSA